MLKNYAVTVESPKCSIINLWNQIQKVDLLN